MDASAVLENVRELSDRFAAERGERQRRRHLDPADFAALAAAGLTRAGVPADEGGLWDSLPTSTRQICELLRVLARGDSSVALVSAMHPSVLALWLANPRAPERYAQAWEEQRRAWFQTARDGAWWGTITSEAGSGGDVTRTKATARRDGDGYRLSGAKQFGSGSGVTSHVITTAIPEGEPDADWFVLTVRDAPWDGSTGMRLIGEWDGHGMVATQSHAMAFEDFPATRLAWEGNLRGLIDGAASFFGCAFTAVVVGVAEAAVAAARERLAPRRDSMRAYERTEWVQAELEGWLLVRAYEGMLAAVEQRERPLGDVRRGKLAVAQLAEASLGRICRVMGGGSYAAPSPFGYWFEDVRALGFLRPPWALSHDALFDDGFAGDTA